MKTVIVVVVVWLLGLSWAKIDQVKNYKQFFHPNYPAVRQRFARAQPAIYAPGKALSWVDNYYERSYAPQPYSFGYEVNDGYNNYGHQQESDGSVTTGSYRVLLPDGRTQIVNFRADKNGYVADVKYEVSLFKPSSSSSSSSYSNRAPAATTPAPSYKVPAKSVSPKAWTAFTQFKPAAKRASYKSDLIAAYGSKVIQDGPGRPADSYKALDGNEIEYVQPITTPTTPSYVIAEPIDAYGNDPTTPVYSQNPATTEYQASTSTTTTPAPITAERDDAIVDSVGAWTAFKAADEDTSAPIYEAKAVYQVIPETDYGTSDPRPASESYIHDIRAPAIIPAESSSSSQDVRISPAYGEVESTSTTPYQAAPSTQPYRVEPVASSPQYEIATSEDGDSPGPSTPAYSVQPPIRPPIQPPSEPKIPEILSYDEPERPSTETYSPTDAVPAGAAPWSAFRQLPAANRIKPVPFYAREGYVAPTTYKPPIAFRFSSSASAENNQARPAAAAAAASSRRVSSAPAWTAWTAFRPTHHRSSAAATPAPSNSRLPSPLIFRQRKA